MYWIPITRTMPKPGTYAITFDTDAQVLVHWFDGERWFTHEHNEAPQFAVTHWMVMPDPPIARR